MKCLFSLGAFELGSEQRSKIKELRPFFKKSLTMDQRLSKISSVPGFPLSPLFESVRYFH